MRLDLGEEGAETFLEYWVDHSMESRNSKQQKTSRYQILKQKRIIKTLKNISCANFWRLFRKSNNFFWQIYFSSSHDLKKSLHSCKFFSSKMTTFLFWTNKTSRPLKIVKIFDEKHSERNQNTPTLNHELEIKAFVQK